MSFSLLLSLEFIKRCHYSFDPETWFRQIPFYIKVSYLFLTINTIETHSLTGYT